MKNFIILIILASTLSCSNKENNYNKMLDWMHETPKGTPIETVKATQPDFVIVDWKDIDESHFYRFDVKPKNFYDILHMANWLKFDSSGRYIGRGYSK